MATNFTNTNISSIKLGDVKYNLKSVPFHATEAEWLSINYVPKAAEIIVYDADENVIASEDFSVTGINQKISLSADVDGSFYVVVHTYNSTGSNRVNIDNLNIVSETSVKRELVSTVTTETTSYEFKNLEEGFVYLYRVKASDGDATSAFSEYVEVALISTGIGEFVADGDWCGVYSLAGVYRCFQRVCM